ncbi:MAG: epimerase [Rhodocyclales bacterium]|nr:epimerase [Rhodocyclales bacterium]
MKRCLLIGGAGFIGTAVVQALLVEGSRHVLVLGRSVNPVRELPAGVDYVCAPPERSHEVLMRVLPSCDEVIDMAYASVPKTSFEDPVHDVLVNLPFSVDLLKLASEHALSRFVFVSSGGTVYGNPLYLPIDEQHPTNPVSPYGITKLALEKYGQMYQRLASLPFMVVRPGNPYGPGQSGNLGQGFVATAIQSALQRQPLTVFGERGTVRDYIHVDDLARAIVAVLLHGRTGDVYNAGTGQGNDNVMLLDRLRPLAAADGLALEVHHQPARPFDVAANVLSVAKLTYDTGWRPRIDIDEGLVATWSAAKVVADWKSEA